MTPTTSWLVECYWPRSSSRPVEEVVADLERGREGTVTWVAVPEDDTLFVLVEGTDAGAVEGAARAAGLAVQRIVPSSGINGLLTPSSTPNLTEKP